MLNLDAKNGIPRLIYYLKVFEMESHKTEQDTEHGTMGELAKNILCGISNSINQLEDCTIAISLPRKVAETDDYDFDYHCLVIRGHILSRFPKISESILGLLVDSVVERREILLSLGKGGAVQSRGSEPEKNQKSFDIESFSSVESLSWNDHPYPDPPEADGDAKVKLCDWCHDELDVVKLKDVKWWR